MGALGARVFLNLGVEDWVVADLLKLPPALVEDGATIRYPDRYREIPKLRRAYNYYRGTAVCRGERQDVLVRRALNPVPRRVELFAAVSLKLLFGLRAGDPITVEL